MPSRPASFACDPNARGDGARGEGGDSHRLLVQSVQELLGDPLGSGCIGLRKQNRELVATEPGKHVAGAQPGGEQLGDRNDHLVASLVSERVVDVFEVVEVEHQEGALGAITPHERSLLAQ
jgi:hypothetical protein